MTAGKRTGLSWVWLLVVVMAGAGISALLLLTGPQTEPEKKQRAVKIVQVVDVETHTAGISVTAYGTVIPARRLDIQLQVGGRVVSQHDSLVPGGRISAKEQIVQIDPSDYQLAIEEKRADLKIAEFEFEVEAGRQVVAAREWSLLEKDLKPSEVNRSLVLREPHLKRAEAAVSKANNAIAKAVLDLSRTAVVAPFNAVVVSESVEVNQLVESGNSIAVLAGTDVFWVQVTLPIEDLRWLKFPDPDKDTKGATAVITLDTGDTRRVTWNGEVVRLLGDLETSGRMARALVAVKDPLGLPGEANTLPLLLGSYVRVEIDAGEIDEVISIPRSALRSGNRLWSVDAENKLRIHDTEVRWVEGDNVLVTNTLGPGEKLIVSSLRTALPGMTVEAQAAPESASAEE